MLKAFFKDPKMKFTLFKFRYSYFRRQIIPLVFKLQKLPTPYPFSPHNVCQVPVLQPVPEGTLSHPVFCTSLRD